MRISPSLAAAMLSISMLLLIGTAVYRSIEGWSWLDSFYFTGMTLTTIGFGDIHPTHDASKLFTVFFAFAGVGTFFYALSAVMGQAFHEKGTDFIEYVRKRAGRRNAYITRKHRLN